MHILLIWSFHSNDYDVENFITLTFLNFNGLLEISSSKPWFFANSAKKNSIFVKHEKKTFKIVWFDQLIQLAMTNFDWIGFKNWAILTVILIEMIDDFCEQNTF